MNTVIGLKQATVIVAKLYLLMCVLNMMQVLTEIAGETLEQMAAAPKNKAAPSRVAAAPQEEEDEEDNEAADLQARLNAIRS